MCCIAMLYFCVIFLCYIICVIFLCSIFVSYFRVVFLCYILVFYFSVIYFCYIFVFYFSCYIACNISFLLYCTHLYFLQFTFCIVLYLSWIYLIFLFHLFENIFDLLNHFGFLEWLIPNIGGNIPKLLHCFCKILHWSI